MKGTMALLLTLALVAAACGEGSTASTTTSGAQPSVTTTTTSAPPTSTTSTTTTIATTTSLRPTTTLVIELPGEPIDFGPGAGEELIVIGVAFDDTLNVREIPGLGGPTIDRLPPTGGAVAVGNTRLLTQSIWYEVDTGGIVGWANSRFLAYEGLTDDITAAIVSDLGGPVSAETMEDLAGDVAASRASTEPASDITITVGPSEGDLVEITVDVVGLGDDAVAGERLHIFATADENGFTLVAVERTLLCGRGASGDGLCV